MVTLDPSRTGFDADEPRVRPYSSEDFRWGLSLLDMTGGRYRVRRGKVVDVATQPGLVACRGDERVGLVTLARHREALELAVLCVAPFDDEVSALLINAARTYAGPTCRRLFSICSNAELEVQRSLQVYGFQLAACRPGIVEAVRHRSTDPIVEQLGELAVRDELEFDWLLP